MVNNITRELDDYLESRIGDGDIKKKKKKNPITYSKVPKIDNEYKTFVLDDEAPKPWYRKFLDWLFEDDSTSEDDYSEKIEVAEEARIEKVSDMIENAEEDLEELELNEEKKVRNIFQRLFDKLRKVEAEEIKELEDVEMDTSQMEDLTAFKSRCNNEIRDALRSMRKILYRLPSNALDEVQAMSEYQNLQALMRKYKVE